MISPGINDVALADNLIRPSGSWCAMVREDVGRVARVGALAGLTINSA
jgi:hypothetical protein